MNPTALPHADRFAVVAIPACNEVDRIGACLAALAVQRDACGAPLPGGSFEILVFANNCGDGTAEMVGSLASGVPHPVSVVVETLLPAKANAGWARKRAMDLAAQRLSDLCRPDGVIMTTDADSAVAPIWVAASLEAIAKGADCVAGYIDAHAAEIIQLGPAFLQRGRLEDRYLRLVAEIHAICDPRPHDPWPNHRVSSGASLAVTLDAYRAIGGLPPRPVGEDAALTQALERAGFKVRHAMDVSVSTSCRFDGRASGGAADTMRHRHAVLDAPCDAELEPALFIVRRTLHKGRLRLLWDVGLLADGAWGPRLGLDRSAAGALVRHCAGFGFEEFWLRLGEASPVLRRRHALRPSDLPGQIARAETCLRLLRSQPGLGPERPVERSEANMARAASAMARSGTG